MQIPACKVQAEALYICKFNLIKKKPLILLFKFLVMNLGRIKLSCLPDEWVSNHDELEVLPAVLTPHHVHPVHLYPHYEIKNNGNPV
jgi:hypothetical protein